MRARRWSQADTDKLVARYPHELTRIVALDLGRTESACSSRAKLLGVKKTPEFLATQGGRLDGTQGKKTQFVKGHVSHNKGKKMASHPNTVASQFKKGQRPPNTAPIGSERYTHKDRYLERKMTDTGVVNRDWVAVHKLVWIEHNGPIKKGSVIVFKNKDNSDIRIENLECITRGELMRRNSIHKIPKELQSIIRAKGQLTRAINKQERHSEKQNR